LCLGGTKKDKNGKSVALINRVVVPVITANGKELFYRFCFNNSFVHSTNPLLKNKIMPSDEKNKVNDGESPPCPYKNIPLDVLEKMQYTVKKESDKYQEIIESLWTNVMIPYLSGENKMIFGKINAGLLGFKKFHDFMSSLPASQAVDKINKRLNVTLSNVSASTTGHKEI
jgi:hypothetical protein